VGIVLVCVCVCVCVCVYIYTHTHTHTHTCIYIYIYMFSVVSWNRVRHHFSPQKLTFADFFKFHRHFYVLLTVHPCIIFFKWSQLGAHYFLVHLFQFLYMFRATVCPSSGELTVSMRHKYFSLCMGGCLVWCRPDSHPSSLRVTMMRSQHHLAI